MLLGQLSLGCVPQRDQFESLVPAARADLAAGRFYDATDKLQLAIEFAPGRPDLHLLLYEAARRGELVIIATQQESLLAEAGLLGSVSPGPEIAATIPIEDFSPEGIAFDDTSQSILIGSVCHQSILLLDSAAGVEWFWQESGPETMQSVQGIVVVDSTIWVCCAVIPLCDTALAPQYGASSLLEIDRATGVQRNRYHTANPDASLHLNDLARLTGGDLVVTAYHANRLFVLRRGKTVLEPLPVRATPLPHPNGICADSSGHTLFVATDNGIVHVDPATGDARLLRSHPSAFPVAIDGLRRWGNDLIAVQQGHGLSRIVRYILSADRDSIVATEIVVPNDTTRGQLTTGAIGPDGSLWFVVDAQWSRAGAAWDNVYQVGRVALPK